MAHYAFLDENSIVSAVIVGRDESDLPEDISDWEAFYESVRGQTCRRTSYNTEAGEHRLGGVPFRGNFADIGYVYDPDLDAFYEPQPYPSWTLNLTTFTWEAPTPEPTSGGPWEWLEETQEWTEMVLEFL